MPRRRPSPVRAAAAFLLLPALACAQQVAAAPAEGGQQQTLLHHLVGSPAIWLLAGCSFVIVWFSVDTFLKTKLDRFIPKATTDALKDFFRQGDYVGAYNYCRANPGVLTNVVRAGLGFVADGKTATEEAMAMQMMKERDAYLTRISYLSVIGVIAPMIGLSGTVFGMIDAFGALGQAGAADPSKLSAAIGEILWATASGLVVAIPAFVAYYLLRSRIQKAVHFLQDEVHLLFRRMPYEHMVSANISESEVYANLPNWLPGVDVAGQPTA